MCDLEFCVIWRNVWFQHLIKLWWGKKEKGEVRTAVEGGGVTAPPILCHSSSTGIYLYLDRKYYFFVLHKGSRFLCLYNEIYTVIPKFGQNEYIIMKLHLKKYHNNLNGRVTAIKIEFLDNSLS